jgi:hypothetical protein
MRGPGVVLGGVDLSVDSSKVQVSSMVDLVAVVPPLEPAFLVTAEHQRSAALKASPSSPPAELLSTELVSLLATG